MHFCISSETGEVNQALEWPGWWSRLIPGSDLLCLSQVSAGIHSSS